MEGLIIKLLHREYRPRQEHRKTLEHSMRLSTNVGPEPLTRGPASPTYRVADLWTPLSASSLLRWFYTVLRFASTLLLKVSLIQGLRFIAPSYIYIPAPPPPGHPDMKKP